MLVLRKQKSIHRKKFVNAIQSCDPATTEKIQNEIGCVYSAASRRLEELEESCAVKSKKTGGNRVWRTADLDE